MNEAGTSTLDELDQLHGDDTLGERPDLAALSDEDLIDSVENPSNPEDPGLNECRNAFKLQPRHFNTIQKPNFLEQIWEKLKAVESIAQSNFTIKEFFGLVKNPVYPERPYSAHEKVTAIYSYLNMIGFHPDKPLHKERGFIRASSDLRHASIASLTHLLISCDNRFVSCILIFGGSDRSTACQIGLA